jgi:hypothetical protein
MLKLNRLAAALVLAIVLGAVNGPLFNVAAAPLGATAPGLGTAASFSVLGKAGVTNSGNSVLSGNVGADLAAAITGFPPGTVGGSVVVAPAVNQPEFDVAAADLALTTQGPGTPEGPDLTGLTLGPGVYSVGAALLPGVLTLNGPGVYIFLVSSDLTASGSVILENGASPCNVFWHVTTTAHITGGAFVGTIIATAAVTFGSAASLDGRAFGETANVTLIDNHISGPTCLAATETSVAATQTQIAAATQTQGPAATQTQIAGATQTQGPAATQTHIAAFTNTPTPQNTPVPTPQNTPVPTPQNTPVPAPTETPLPAPTETATAPAVVGLPATGGGPLPGPAFPWAEALAAGSLSALVLGLGLRGYRRRGQRPTH